MVEAHKATPDIDVLASSISIPAMGTVPINAFVLHGPEPMLIDTGAVVQTADFMKALRSAIDPQKLRWIWLTHTDADHIGSLHQLLNENPRIKVVTTFLGFGIMGLFAPLPMDRVHLVNPGEKFILPDRTLTAFKPPVFDNPCTTGFYDDKSRVLFSSDCFGALLANVPQDAREISPEALHEGQVRWATVDSPWLHKVDRGALAKELEAIRRMEPAMILSSHLPMATSELTDRLLSAIADAPSAPPFVGPNQAALEALLRQA